MNPEPNKPSSHHPIVFHQESIYIIIHHISSGSILQGGSNMTGTDLCVNNPHCAAAVRP